MTRYFIAGHQGLVGGAILRALEARQRTVPGLRLLTRGRDKLDLTDAPGLRAYFRDVRPEVVILNAARSGGIHANTAAPAEFIHQNLLIAVNVIHAAHEAGVQRLLQCSASSIYPRFAAQPIPEAALLTGKLDSTTEADAVAKIAAIKLCESYNRQYGRDYRSVTCCNLYGPGDSFAADTARVIPALIRRFHDAVRSGASEVTIWGTGTPRREFLHVDDMAVATLFLLDLPPPIYRANTRPTQSHINIGSGEEVSIRELAGMIARLCRFRGQIRTDPDKPDGPPRRLLDCTLVRAMGWRPRIDLEEGLEATYRWFLENRPGLPA